MASKPDRVEFGPGLCELVLLSTCNSGRGGAGGGIELYTGIDGAFLTGGARTVISTLWNVNDLASFLFMTNLHVGLRAAGSTVDAFENSVHLLRHGGYRAVAPDSELGAALNTGRTEWQQAITAVGDRFMDAYVWAPFRLSGGHWLAQPLAP